MNLSKADAAKTIGVSRQTLYTYIKNSRISVGPDGTIDTAELLRAGFTLHQAGQSEHVDTRHDVTPSNVQVDTYREMIELLRQQLADAREREQAYREQLALISHMLQESHQQNQRLLDMPRQVVSKASVPQRHAPAIPETWQQILGYMQQQSKAVSPMQVQRALGLTTEARHVMHRMVQRGVLQRVKPGVYVAADNGGHYT